MSEQTQGTSEQNPTPSQDDQAQHDSRAEQAQGGQVPVTGSGQKPPTNPDELLPDAMAVKALQGKTVIVTGANSGIGAAIANGCAAAGANVVIDWVTHPEAVDPEVQVAENAGVGSATAVQADVSKVDDIQKLIDAAVEKFGRLDVMINNAGVENRLGLLDTEEKDYDFVMDINMKGTFFGSKLAAQQFIKQGVNEAGSAGVIINISSVHEEWPMPGNTVYCVSKGGSRMLTRTAGVELAKHGIRMVNIAPGAIDTPINAQTMANPETAKALDDSIPLKRVGRPDEIASVAVFLASDAGSYVTATTFTVDGGITQAAGGL